MRALVAPVLVVLATAACGEDASYLTITVTSRPAVHDASTLKVTLTNAGSTYSDDLDLGDKTFPVTFTISAPGRMGELGIAVDALDAAGTLVGRGTGATTLDEMSAIVTLDSADFVVNTDYAMDQFLSTDFEAVGFQLAGASNGQWMAVFRDECTGSSVCDIYGRRFDATGLPVFSMLAAGDIQFKLTTETTTTLAMPAVAASGLNTLAFWDYTESTGGARGIACRAINEMGGGSGNQISIADDASDVVSAAGLSNGDFAVTWQAFLTATTSTYYARAAIVGPDCSVRSPGVVSVSASASSTGSFGAGRPHVATNGAAILYSWITDDNLWVRTSTLMGVLGPEKRILDGTAGQAIEHVRVAPWKDGFAIAVRWASRQTDGPGKIELYFATNLGDLTAPPVLITDESRSDFASSKGFSLASRDDDSLLVVWHVCQTGPGLCDVYGRTFRPTGAAVGEPFMLPTSTASEQINPSVIAVNDTFVAAWNDSSGEAPDRDGTSVRARVITPVYDDARGVHGATCGPGAPGCDEGLACGMGTDGAQRCYYTCSGSCPRGGTCNTVDGAMSACTF